MIKKETYTKIFLKEWNKCADETNIKYYTRKWWKSVRSTANYGLRLSKDGYDFLTSTLELQSYDIPFTEEIIFNPQLIIFLDRYLDCPYYLTHHSITVFTERRMFELCMFSDDIRKFGLTKAMNERDNDEKVKK